MIGEHIAAKRVRLAWIDGVNEYYPGMPKPSYVTPWEQMTSWEQEAVTSLHQQVGYHHFTTFAAGNTSSS